MTEQQERPKMSDEAHQAFKDNLIMMVDKNVIEKGDPVRDALKGAIVMLESMGLQVPAFWPMIIWSGRCPYEEFKRVKEEAA